MPTYNYICENCGKVEVFLPIKKRKINKCPNDGCDGDVKRIVTGHPGIRFKGDNFYANNR